MNTTNPLRESIPAFLRDHPGATPAEIHQAVGRTLAKVRWMLTKLSSTGLIFWAGRSHSRHYYADKAQAEASHAQIVRDQIAAAYEARRKNQIGYYYARQSANKRVRKSVAKNADRFNELDAAILGLCKNPLGMRAKPILDHDQGAVYGRLRTLKKRGVVFVGSLGPRSKRYFMDPAQAKAWEESRLTISQPRSDKAGPRALARNAPVIERDVEIQRIPHQDDYRYAVSGSFDRTITSDWMLRRQGVDIRSVIGLTP